MIEYLMLFFGKMETSFYHRDFDLYYYNYSIWKEKYVTWRI